MASLNNTWEALLKPGAAVTYFNPHRNEPLRIDAVSYSTINAWWFAELCRLVYRQGPDEIGSDARPPLRSDVLSAVGLEETLFLNNEGTQCAVVGPFNARDRAYTVVVFRGTDQLQDWLVNLKALSLSDFRPERWPEGGRVHAGFNDALDRVWPELQRQLAQSRGPIFYTGHSLGAALATLAASRQAPRALYTFGSPRVGDKEFVATLSTCLVFRVVNNRDVVAAVPPASVGFCHAGELHYIASDGRLLVGPRAADVAVDRELDDPTFDPERRFLRRLVRPPQFLADHAPANYVAHLEKHVGRGG